jgi:tRNA1(Val) A37 N6-methylase TrmN6
MLADVDTTDDAALGGRLVLRQPRKGHRFGHDAILLAAATDARPGERACELGAGVGAAGLALAHRVAGLAVTLVEVDPTLARLARDNASRNGLAGRVTVAALDVGAPARAFAETGLAAASCARVLMNPPFNDPARQNVSPDAQRRLAHLGSAETLSRWIDRAAFLLAPSGTLTLIWRADGLADVLSAAAAFGGIVVLPVFPRPGAAAIRIIVSASKGSRAPLVLLPGLTLNDAEGKPSAAAEAVLRDGAALALKP